MRVRDVGLILGLIIELEGLLYLLRKSQHPFRRLVLLSCLVFVAVLKQGLLDIVQVVRNGLD